MPTRPTPGRTGHNRAATPYTTPVDASPARARLTPPQEQTCSGSSGCAASLEADSLDRYLIARGHGRLRFLIPPALASGFRCSSLMPAGLLVGAAASRRPWAAPGAVPGACPPGLSELADLKVRLAPGRGQGGRACLRAVAAATPGACPDRWSAAGRAGACGVHRLHRALARGAWGETGLAGH